MNRVDFLFNLSTTTKIAKILYTKEKRLQAFEIRSIFTRPNTTPFQSFLIFIQFERFSEAKVLPNETKIFFIFRSIGRHQIVGWVYLRNSAPYGQNFGNEERSKKIFYQNLVHNHLLFICIYTIESRNKFRSTFFIIHIDFSTRYLQIVGNQIGM